MIIPWQNLSTEALEGVIEEFVTREGTDYGHNMTNLEAKVRQVKGQLECGEAVLVFDKELSTCSISPAINGKLTESGKNLRNSDS